MWTVNHRLWACVGTSSAFVRITLWTLFCWHLIGFGWAYTSAAEVSSVLKSPTASSVTSRPAARSGIFRRSHRLDDEHASWNSRGRLLHILSRRADSRSGASEPESSSGSRDEVPSARLLRRLWDTLRHRRSHDSTSGAPDSCRCSDSQCCVPASYCLSTARVCTVRLWLGRRWPLPC